MNITKRANNKINYSNRKKPNSDFMNKDLRRSNCFSCDFSNSNFNYTSFRGAQFKSCNFSECTFDSAELIATNLKNSRFKKVKFENTIFDSVNLDGVDFEGAEFKNVIFVATDMSGARNLELSNQDVKIFDTMPELAINITLEKAAKSAMRNEFVKFARVLDTKDGKINPIAINRLLESFDEETLINGLRAMKLNVKEDLCTLNDVVKVIEGYKAQNLI